MNTVLSQTPLLETRQLTVGIGDLVFCKALDLTLKTGESLAILGRNGTGKSTLLSTLAGIRTPQEGEVLLAGQRYATLGARKSALWRGWLPQKQVDPFASTVLETVLVGRHPHLERWAWESQDDAKIVRQALQAVGLSLYEHRDIRSLSGGERQRLAIATLLAQAPQLFLLDEPMAHLDLPYQMAMLELFRATTKKQGKTVVMVLHEPALAYRFFDRVLLIYGDGTTESGDSHTLLSAERLSCLYQYPLEKVANGESISFIPK